MTSALTTVLLLVGIVLCGVAIWAVFRLVAAADSVRRLADDLEARVPELLDKADVTVDAVNVELLRMDLIVTQVEEVTELVSSASSAVHAIVNAPYEVVSGLSERLRRSLHVPHRNRAHQAHRKQLEPHEEVELLPAVEQQDQADRQDQAEQSLVEESWPASLPSPAEQQSPAEELPPIEEEPLAGYQEQVGQL